MSLFLFNLIGGFVGSQVLLSLAIILGASLLEDLTIITVSVLAADGLIPVPIALLSLYVGVIIGDMALYSLGWLARTHPRLAYYIDHNSTLFFRSWLEKRYAFTIFSSHFIPGLRVTTYIASGFFRRPLSTFIPMAIMGGIVLVTAFFSLSYWFGSITSGWAGPVRWGIAGVFLLVLFFIGRHNLMAYRTKKADANVSRIDV